MVPPCSNDDDDDDDDDDYDDDDDDEENLLIYDVKSGLFVKIEVAMVMAAAVVNRAWRYHDFGLKNDTETIL